MVDGNQGTNVGLSSDEGQTSSGDGKTSQEAPRAYTVEEWRRSKEYSDALASAGRTKIAEKDEIISDLTRRLEELENASAGDDNEKLNALQRKRKDAEKEKLLRQKDARIAELEEKARKADEYEQMEAYKGLAGQYENIDPKDLVGKSEEDAKAFCKRYGVPKNSETSAGKVDGGRSSGGGGGREPTLQELQNSTPEETARKIKSGEWKVRGWIGK